MQHQKQCLRLRVIGAKIQKINFKNFTPGATKKLKKKPSLEPKLLNFKCCSFVPTLLTLVFFRPYKKVNGYVNVMVTDMHW